jgi:hypothetical protein
VADLLFANLVPIFGILVALIGITIFRLSRRDRPMAAVVVVVGFAFVVLWFGAREGSPPADSSRTPAATASPANDHRPSTTGG